MPWHLRSESASSFVAGFYGNRWGAQTSRFQFLVVVREQVKPLWSRNLTLRRCLHLQTKSSHGVLSHTRLGWHLIPQTSYFRFKKSNQEAHSLGLKRRGFKVTQKLVKRWFDCYNRKIKKKKRRSSSSLQRNMWQISKSWVSNWYTQQHQGICFSFQRHFKATRVSLTAEDMAVFSEGLICYVIHSLQWDRLLLQLLLLQSVKR